MLFSVCGCAAVVALAAGASTGIISDIVLFPLDFLKTHAQVNVPASPSVAPPATPPPAGAALSGPLLSSRDSAETVRRGISTDIVGAGARSALTGPNVVSSAAAPAATWKTPCGVKSKGRPTTIGACYSGIAALAMGSMPSSAVFFVAYEMAKEKLKRLSPCQPAAMLRYSPPQVACRSSAASAVAYCSAAAIMLTLAMLPVVKLS